VQKISLDAREKAGFAYQSQAQIALRHAAGAKIPDAVWHDKIGDYKIAVEVEFSQKFGRKLDQTIAAIVDSLQNREYRCYFFFVRHSAISTNYGKAIEPGATYDIWEKNERGAWIFFQENRRVVPTWLIERVFFMDANEPFKDPRQLEFDL